MLKTALKEWAKETRALIDAETLKLIGEANFDLYYGPSGGGLDDEESTYPGFVTACRKIHTALSDVVPSVLYVDDQDCWSTVEPCAEECPDCGGTGKMLVEGEDEDDADGHTYCRNCDGRGGFEPTPYYEVDRAELVRAIVGRELAGHVS